MVVEENKALIRRYIEDIWNSGNLKTVDEIIAADFIFHGLDRDLRGPGALKQYIVAVRRAFPDLHFTIEDLLAERAEVVSRWTMTGTHKGEFMGIAATNKNFKVPGTSITRVVKGKLLENWVYWDRLSLMQRLGVIPTSFPQPRGVTK